MSSARCGFLNNRLFQPASLSRGIACRELRRLKSIHLYCIVLYYVSQRLTLPCSEHVIIIIGMTARQQSASVVHLCYWLYITGN